jgi:hypothetical protein
MIRPSGYGIYILDIACSVFRLAIRDGSSPPRSAQHASLVLARIVRFCVWISLLVLTPSLLYKFELTLINNHIMEHYLDEHGAKKFVDPIF